MYAADIVNGRILAIDLNTSSVSVLYQPGGDLLPYTIAAGQQFIYFSAWNRKLVRIFGDCCNVYCIVTFRQCRKSTGIPAHCVHLSLLAIAFLRRRERHKLITSFMQTNFVTTSFIATTQP